MDPIIGILRDIVATTAEDEQADVFGEKLDEDVDSTLRDMDADGSGHIL